MLKKSHNVEKSVAKVLHPNPEVDDLQNLISSSPDQCLPAGVKV